MTKPPILTDHKRIRKKLIPPFMQLGAMRLTSWADVTLPEIVWFAVFHERLGLPMAVPLLVELTEKIVALCHTSVLFVSDFTEIKREHLENVAASLSAPDRVLLNDALSPFLRLYPTCPLSPLKTPVIENEPTEEDVAWFKKLVTHMLDRTSRVATIAQASAVYLAKLQHRFSSFQGSSLSNFAEIEDYPATPESQRVASGIRGTLNMLIYKEQSAPQVDWARYFWNRSFQLEPCYFSSGQANDTE